MAYEDIALTDQPDGSHDQRAPISVGHEAAVTRETPGTRDGSLFNSRSPSS